jgi:hypothetical protein
MSFSRPASMLFCRNRTDDLSLGEQVDMPPDELLDGLSGSAGDFLDRGGHAVIAVLAI